MLKTLHDAALYPAWPNLEKTGEEYKVVKASRNEKGEKTTYRIYPDGDISIEKDNSKVLLSKTQLSSYVETILSSILKNKKGTFSVPSVEEELLKKGHTLSLASSSDSKSDVNIEIIDHRSAKGVEIGFSIKSQLGSPSTLVNASKKTNFKFKISHPNQTNLTDNDIDYFNSAELEKSKIKGIIDNIYNSNSKLIYVRDIDSIFHNNLTLIDSRLPEILSELLKANYYECSEMNKIDELTEYLEKTNPLNFPQSNKHRFYEYKIKKYLLESALGMMPSKVWDGNLSTDGGYLIVKRDGNVICFFLYNRNDFEEYLFRNTKIDTPSTKRHDFGSAYKEGNDSFINLNYQIRFIR